MGLLLCLMVGGIGYWLLNRPEPEEPKETLQDAENPPAGEESDPVEAEEPQTETAGSDRIEPEVPPEPEKTPEELLEEQVDAVLSKLTTEEKVLQLFMITPEALTGVLAVTAAGEHTKEAVLQYPVGGIIYFANNLKEPEQVRTMLANTRQYYEEAGYPAPFLGVDEEGGRVARVGSQDAFGVEKFPDMYAVGEQGDVEEAARVGRVIGSYLSDLGFTVDFAPVADVWTEPENEVIGRRSFGTDPELVAEFACAQAKGLQEAGVWAVLKHFPGHGATKSDSHDGYAYTDQTLEELMNAELIPFNRGIREGICFIMAGHISVPSVTGDQTPCTLSSYMITDVLRGTMGYDGIVTTDAMNMGAIRKQYSPAQASVLALQAGVDLILMPEDFSAAYEGVLAALETGELTEARIEESVRRILRVKCRTMDQGDGL